MKTFVIQERFTGYADIHIEAETEDEAMKTIVDNTKILSILWMICSTTINSIQFQKWRI